MVLGEPGTKNQRSEPETSVLENYGRPGKQIKNRCLEKQRLAFREPETGTKNQEVFGEPETEGKKNSENQNKRKN